MLKREQLFNKFEPPGLTMNQAVSIEALQRSDVSMNDNKSAKQCTQFFAGQESNRSFSYSAQHQGREQPSNDLVSGAACLLQYTNAAGRMMQQNSQPADTSLSGEGNGAVRLRDMCAEGAGESIFSSPTMGGHYDKAYDEGLRGIPNLNLNCHKLEGTSCDSNFCSEQRHKTREASLKGTDLPCSKRQFYQSSQAEMKGPDAFSSKS